MLRWLVLIYIVVYKEVDGVLSVESIYIYCFVCKVSAGDQNYNC